MSIRCVVLTGLAGILLLPIALAQGRGSGGMQGQGRKGQGAPPFAGNPPTGSRPTRGTQQQQARYRVCEQSLNRFRKRVRAMAKLGSANTFNRQQLTELQDQLLTDLQSIQQDRQSLAESLSEEQKSANQARLQEMTRSQEDLELFSEALGFELEQADIDSSKVQKNVEQLEKASRALEKQQHSLAESLGVD